MKLTESDAVRAPDKGILVEYEASLIRRVDLQGKGVIQAAGEDNKSKGTVGLQHTTASRKLTAFFEEERKVQAGGELAAEVFRLPDAGKSARARGGERSEVLTEELGTIFIKGLVVD